MSEGARRREPAGPPRRKGARHQCASNPAGMAIWNTRGSTADRQAQRRRSAMACCPLRSQAAPALRLIRSRGAARPLGDQQDVLHLADEAEGHDPQESHPKSLPETPPVLDGCHHPEAGIVDLYDGPLDGFHLVLACEHADPTTSVGNRMQLIQRRLLLAATIGR